MSYKGEWIKLLGNADFMLNATVNAPNNTINFFGRGNETPFVKSGDFKRYYRTRFNTYQIDPSLGWRNNKGGSISIGPSFQRYSFDSSDNEGRFINNTGLIKSYDSLTLGKDKLHAGVVLNLRRDKRNDQLLPAWGSMLSLKVQGYKGLNSYSKSFIQILPEVAVYRSLNRSSTIVLADRVGGGITLGKTAFYQSMFLGGHNNLLGYRQYRFAGQHMVYNNLEMRVKVSDFANYILPGQIGLLAFYDTGRVWEENEESDRWHHGTGGGLYFAPARVTLFRLLAGYSKEGWLPFVAMNFRF